MKNFKLPVISDEERKKIWGNLKPNDKLVSIIWNYWNDEYEIKYFTVIKKTVKGNVRIDNGDLIKSFDSNLFIINYEVNECIKRIELEKNIENLLYKVDKNKKDFKKKLDYEDAIKLEEILQRILNK